MRIVQMLPKLSYGDAIGNETVALYKMFHEEGYDTSIYAESVDDRMKSTGLARKLGEHLSFSSDDIIVYHLATGSEWNEKVLHFGAKVVYVFHNVTPPVFMGGPENPVWLYVERGIRDLRQLASEVRYCIADSEYNKENLISLGFKCDITVIPLLIPFDDYRKKPDAGIIDKYGKYEGTKILFTGRVAPNKKHEDIIRAFHEYKRHIDESALLFLAGNHSENDEYYNDLLDYVAELGCKDVIFTGHISFEELLAYYSVSDCFLCMSEHEGFCVPLVEAFLFDLPVIAYDSSAIKGTLGGAGFLLENKDPIETAMIINKIMSDKDLKDVIVANQRERLKSFEFDIIKKMFLEYLRMI